ncbi:hypothetical protein [Lentilitoribacter sp. Alg239-R112]|uniref:hypothetical protein n=1 Tax=Lentilitoribacter sp. Alg239-R112 TaxID=2305987 RepID=UPI0013A6BB5A|nr:hypothetical protein [Lentilitoribacter sp. Alg239-R112]
MVSVAAKRRRKRGRPRAENVHREPNGRVSRAKNPDNTTYRPQDPIDAMVARLRAIGWNEKPKKVQEYAMKDPRISSYVGRLVINYETQHMHPAPPADIINIDQFNASQKYLQIRNAYHRAIGSPGAYYEDGIGVELTEDEKADSVARAKARWLGVQKAIQEANNMHHGSNLYAAIQIIVVEDQVMPHLIGDLRLALNALDNHFKGVT